MLLIKFYKPKPEFNNPYMQENSMKVIELINRIYYYSI